MLPWVWNCEFMKTKRQLNFSYCSTSKKHQKTLIFCWIWVIKGAGKDWPALSIRLSSLQNTRHRSHISHFHGFLARSCFQAAVAVPQNRYDLFPWAVSAGTWAWLSVTSETGRIWGSPVVRDVWYDISMPYITFLSIGLGSRTDSSVTTINHSRLCRIPATVADGSRKTWHHGYTRSGWSSAPVDHLNGHGSKPWHPGEHQNSW